MTLINGGSGFADDRFMGYLPSVMATATMLHVVNGVEPSIGLKYENQLLGIIGIDKVGFINFCKDHLDQIFYLQLLTDHVQLFLRKW